MKERYSIPEIINKVNNNEKLSDEEFKRINDYEMNRLNAKYCELSNIMLDFYCGGLLDDMINQASKHGTLSPEDYEAYDILSSDDNILKGYLSLLGCSLSYIKPYRYLFDSTKYMISTFGTHTNNIIEARRNGLKYSNSPSYHNKVNFIKEAEEIFNYDSLIGDLHEQIEFNVLNDICAFENNICEDEIDALEESKAKVLKIRKKYI